MFPTPCHIIPGCKLFSKKSTKQSFQQESDVGFSIDIFHSLIDFLILQQYTWLLRTGHMVVKSLARYSLN